MPGPGNRGLSGLLHPSNAATAAAGTAGGGCGDGARLAVHLGSCLPAASAAPGAAAAALGTACPPRSHLFLLPLLLSAVATGATGDAVAAAALSTPDVGVSAAPAAAAAAAAAAVAMGVRPLTEGVPCPLCGLASDSAIANALVMVLAAAAPKPARALVMVLAAAKPLGRLLLGELQPKAPPPPTL